VCNISSLIRCGKEEKKGKDKRKFIISRTYFYLVIKRMENNNNNIKQPSIFQNQTKEILNLYVNFWNLTTSVLTTNALLSLHSSHSISSHQKKNFQKGNE